MAGGKPVCVDVNSEFEMDLDQVVDKINPNTFGIMPVHLYGHFTNVLELKDICDEHGLFMIEDASQGVGVKGNDDSYAGTVGHVGVLSFYGNKFVTSAQGAMLLSNDQKILKKAKSFKNHGRLDRGTFVHQEIGYNFCTSDLHSSLGYAQLQRFEEIRLKKLEIFDRYEKNLRSSTNIQLDKIKSDEPAYWFISIFCENAENLEKSLASKGIQTRRCFPPLSLQPCYSNSSEILFCNDTSSKNIFNTYLSLPSKATLTNDEIDFISSEVINAG